MHTNTVHKHFLQPLPLPHPNQQRGKQNSAQLTLPRMTLRIHAHPKSPIEVPTPLDIPHRPLLPVPPLHRGRIGLEHGEAAEECECLDGDVQEAGVGLAEAVAGEGAGGVLEGSYDCAFVVRKTERKEESREGGGMEGRTGDDARDVESVDGVLNCEDLDAAQRRVDVCVVSVVGAEPSYSFSHNHKANQYQYRLYP